MTSPDGGADTFRERDQGTPGSDVPTTTIEILTPDFLRKKGRC